MLFKIKMLHDGIEEPFCFTKGSLWQKKVLQIIKRLKEVLL